VRWEPRYQVLVTAMTQDVAEMRKRAAAAHPSLFGPGSSAGRWSHSSLNRTSRRTPDGSAIPATAGNCLTVDRGGSWFYPPWLLRSAPRERNPADYRDVMMGFRLARTFPW